jgi:hypothetical protein
MKVLLNAAWALLRQGGRDDAQVALAVSAIALLSGAGLVIALLFGIMARSAEGCGIFCHLSGGGLAILAATGAFAAGGVLGLLFGAPRWGDTAAAQPIGAGVAPGTTLAREAGAGTRAISVRPNTSLEKVADWLTTIIVGLGLVHLRDLRTEVTEMGVWLTNAITLQTAGKNGTPGVVLALTFSVAGFLLVYLWSLRFLPSELEGVYATILKLERTNQVLESEKEGLAKTVEKFRTEPRFALSESAQTALRKQLIDLGADDATADEVVKRYTAATRWIDDPMKDFGPAESEGYKLAVTLKDLQAGIWLFTVTLQSASTLSEERAICLLHNSWGERPFAQAPRADGGFAYEDQTTGAFCVGALVLRPGKPALRLSLDMRTLPGVTEEFKNG